jgi:outer membrane immunogenic protein
MKNNLVAGALAAGAMLIAGSAMAADMPARAPMLMKAPPMAVMTWTGCYLDAGAGYGMWNQDHSTTTTFGGTPNIDTIESTNGGRGWLGRFGAGCDYQVSSSWVIGAFGDYDIMNLKGSMDPSLVGGPGRGGFSLLADEKESSAWYAGARIGYLITPSVLTYVDGGWTQTHFDQMSLMTNLGVLTGTAFPDHTYSGWFLGSGFEYAFTWLPIQGLFVRSEYRYSTYKKDDLLETNIATGLPAGNSGLGDVLHASKQVQTITTSLVWRFNLGH